MTIRITAANAFDTSIANLQRRQQQLTESQEQLTSGKRVRRASDDPAAAAAAERALATIQRTEADQRAMQTSRAAMQLAETALGDAGDLLQQVRERVVQAGNGSYGDNDRRSLAQAIQGLRDDLLKVANRSDGNGRYLFGGQGSDGTPLLDGTGGVTYQGVAGTLRAAAGDSTPLSFDGRAAWLAAPDPANPGSTLSMFTTLDRIVSELNTAGRTSTAIAQGVATGLREIDAISDNLSRFRSISGEALQRADSIDERLAQTRLDAQTDRSNAEDLDMVQAISDFQARQSGYDAALKSYSTVQRMSLFDYLR